jgi:hypothetical protein
MSASATSKFIMNMMIFGRKREKKKEKGKQG